ncbi:MAG TPA: tetratricopeptide repeat protein [Terriglobia bacterium]|jgi:Tfp pilus assembly protein PilF
MQFLKAFVVLPILLILLLSPTTSPAAERSQTVTGRFLFENGDFACDHCMVTLLANSIRPIGTTFVDLSGRFTFTNVPPGMYTVHADIDGFEPVNQTVDLDGVDANLLIAIVRRPPVVSNAGDVVNVREFKEIYPKKAVSYFEKGSSALEGKKYEEAIKDLHEAIQFAPEFYEAHNQLGIAYRDSGQTDDAEKEFIAAHQLNSTGVAPLLNLTTLYLDEDKPDRAVTTGEEAVKINSHSAPAFFSLGVALYKVASLDRAEAAFKRALELAPKMPSVRLMLANVYLKLHRYDRTLDQLNSYIAENPHGQHLSDVQQLRDQLMKATETGQP